MSILASEYPSKFGFGPTGPALVRYRLNLR